MKTVGHRRYVAALLPMNRDMTIGRDRMLKRLNLSVIDEKDTKLDL